VGDHEQSSRRSRSQNTSLAVVAPGIAEGAVRDGHRPRRRHSRRCRYNKFSTDLGRYQDRLDAFAANSGLLGRHLEQQGAKK